VFRDIDTIRRGEDFAQAIESALDACDVVLVVIGNSWATGTGQDGRRRLDDPKDWVRLEVAAALRRNVLVIPVLVDGARLPDPASLPEELRPLCRRHACELSDVRWAFDVGELVKDLKKVVRPPQRLKLLRVKGNRLRWLAGSAVALAVLLGMILIGPAILRVQPQGPNSPISPPSIRPTASQGKQPAGQPAPSQKQSYENTVFRQETKVAGLTAEVTRFVYEGTFITAEVTFRNMGSRPATFCCQDWQLIGEQTGGQLWPDAYGGRVLCGEAKTLAPGETHVAWVKCKVAAFPDDKYSLNIDSVLNRPFEGLALKSQ